jgi:hypothetical protein
MQPGQSEDGDFDDDDCWPDGDFGFFMGTESMADPIPEASSPQVTCVSTRRRTPYGTGIDARRTADTRNYNTSNNQILQPLYRLRFPITNVDLLSWSSTE